MASSCEIISGRLETLDAITGASHDIASKIGRPKPSYNDGKKYTSHKL